MTTAVRLLDLLPGGDYLASVFEAMAWADEEIEKAQARHGEQGRGPIWNSFTLLKATHDKLYREVLYRSHCREILNRVAKGEDTRPGTDAEMIVVLHEASLRAPLNSDASCLYFRLIDRSVPELARVAGPPIDLPSYERVHGRAADDHEAEMRHRLQQASRIK